MEDNKRKKELDNTISIVYNVLKEYKNNEEIEPLYKRAEELMKKRNIKTEN